MKFLAVVVSLVGLVMFIYFGYLLIMAESAVHQLVLYIVAVLPSFALFALALNRAFRD